jgi:hypothetical protein
MKRGLVSPDQPAYTRISGVNEGAALGPFIVQVVDPADEFEVGPPFYWVDCPDETLAYQWYYDVATSTAIGGPTVTYYSIDQATLGQRVSVWPPATPQPANTTTEVPVSASGGDTLYWYNNSWVTSFFSPITYSTLPEAQTYLKEQTLMVGVAACNIQSSNYSWYELAAAADPSVLVTQSYSPMTLGAYQTFINGEVASRDAFVDSATALGQLFTFNPADLDTNPGPG